MIEHPSSWTVGALFACREVEISPADQVDACWRFRQRWLAMRCLRARYALLWALAIVAAAVLLGCGADPPEVVQTVKIEPDVTTETRTTTETVRPTDQCAKFREQGIEMSNAGSELSALIGEIGLLQRQVRIAVDADRAELDRQITDLQRKLATSWDRVSKASSAVKNPPPEAACE